MILLCLLWLLAAPLALAQPIRPRVVFVFDTSGSMGVDVATGLPTGGDGSLEYPGRGTSRLFVAKNAVSALVETTSEVEFALLRYPQLEGLGINRGALDGRQSNTYEGLADRPLHYAGECVGRLANPSANQAASLLVPFGQASEVAILTWMDQRENFPQNKELRADGPTPVVESLRLAAEYLGPVVAGDPVADCRPYAVVLLTDGGESCVPPGERALALGGAAATLQALGVRTYVVAFSVGQQDVELLGVLARAGGTAVDARGRLDLVRGLPYQADDLRGLREAFNRILQEAIPVEACNATDDDCDGRVDEGVLNACGVCGPAPDEACDGQDQDCDGRVDEGALNACGRCGALPAERCNGADDDCDGHVDEAVANACGGCAGVQDEVCNGLDDDCDGRIDNTEAGPLSRPCGRETGACAPGLEQCIVGVWRGCSAIEPTQEACNQVDDDCDGEVDEDEQPCGPAREIGNVGECRIGRRRCDPTACSQGLCAEDGWLQACEDAIGPVDDGCDGRDNDCDGATDEGLINACGRCGPLPPESCNGLDDTCEGRIDEDARCPVGFLCFAGECVQRCDASGECSGVSTCQQVYPGADYCHPDACAGVTCPAGTQCDAAARRCVDPCDEVACPGGCDLGACVPATCRHLGCPPGQICRTDACVPDACAEVECGDDAFCRDGACVPACRRQTCGMGQRCFDGACVDDPCGGRCIRGQVCDPTDGLCHQDPCLGVACPVGMVCSGGDCLTDGACLGVRCPGGTLCREGTCTDETPGGRVQVDAGTDASLPEDARVAPVDVGPVDAGPPDAAPPAAQAGGSGGCHAVGPPAGGGLPLLLLSFGLLGCVRRRGWVVGLLALACEGEPEIRLDPRLDAAPPTVPSFDAAVLDARAGCTPAPEVCNLLDDDCDDLVDAEDPDLQRLLLEDPTNCGVCGLVCEAPRATLACQAGECVIIGCDPGLGDYNGELADGCESDCVITAGGNEVCDERDNDCDGVVDEGFDLQSDLQNCGACGLPCPAAAQAQAECVLGTCTFTCLPGFTDLDPAVDGCEYACEPRDGQVPEYCNGLDDDCDGVADEAGDLVPPEEPCGDQGLCAPQCGACGEGDRCVEGVCVPVEVPAIVCDDDEVCHAAHPGLTCIVGRCEPRRLGPMCDGVDGWRCARPPGWQFGQEVAACDGQDNDCDGRVDEDFAAGLFTADRVTPLPCFVGLGVCQRAGLARCADDGGGTTCSASPGAPTGPDDDCDGDDDDCDGSVDEGFVDAWINLGGFEIHAFEASRPGATAQRPGRDVRDDDAVITWMTGRACSRPGVLPWADVTAEEAEAACQAAGARLCTGAEWSRACGGVQAADYPYEGMFDPRACHGGAFASGGPRVGGDLAGCQRGGVFDLSGNLKEWTAERREGLQVVRGGGYETHLASALACDQQDDLKDAGLRHPALGFRCCR